MPTDDATIHLRVPASLKARWVRASRAAGLRLTEWIIAHVERDMLTHIRIPDGVTFADLKLRREPDGSVSFDRAVIARVCQASGIDAARFEADEDALSSLITGWYRAHRAQGGAPDPVEEDLIAEVRAEDAHGGGISYPPGRA